MCSISAQTLRTIRSQALNDLMPGFSIKLKEVRDSLSLGTMCQGPLSLSRKLSLN